MDFCKNDIIENLIDMNAVLVKINKMITHGMPSDEECTLAPTQMIAITVLKNQPPVNMTQLSELLAIPRQQLTKVIDALVSKGLVDRYQTPNNRRVVMVEISPKGRDFINHFFYNRKNVLLKFIEMLNEGQKQEFLAALNTIKRILSEIETDF